MHKLVAHCDTLQDVMLQLCELVQRDAFTQSLQSLGLLDANSSTVHSNESQKLSRSSSYSTPKHQQGYKVSTTKFVCPSFKFDSVNFS